MRIIKKKKIKFKHIIITIFITLILIIASIYIYKNYKEKQDIYKDKNLLLGTWIYNEYNGTYTFKDNKTYIQYTNEDKTNNYCKGMYKYSYGATNEKGLTIRQDDNYYYYQLTLNIEECYIMNKQSYDKYTKKIYFAINKNNNKDEILFINAETENFFTIKKFK